MTDSLLVLRKLSALRDHTERGRRRRSSTLEVFRADVDLQDAAAMSLLVATQEAIDIALHLAADEGWGTPASYGEAFELLAKRGVVTAELARLLRQVVGVRNRLAHGYGSVDVERLWQELPTGLDALDRFAAAIATWIGPPRA